MDSETPTLGELFRNYGVQKTEAYIKLWLIDLNDVLDLKKPMQGHQIDQIAMGVVQRYKTLKIADLKLLFDRVKFGDYTDKMYDRITIPTVMGWFKRYFDDRCSAAALRSQNDNFSSKHRDVTDNRSESQLEKFKDAMKRYKLEELQKSKK